MLIEAAFQQNERFRARFCLLGQTGTSKRKLSYLLWHPVCPNPVGKFRAPIRLSRVRGKASVKGGGNVNGFGSEPPIHAVQVNGWVGHCLRGHRAQRRRSRSSRPGLLL